MSLLRVFVLSLSCILSSTVLADNFKCQDILNHSSNNWIDIYCEKYTNHTCSTLDIIKAIDIYGQCYQQRTAELRKKLGESGTGPLMGVNGNFIGFSHDLDSFTRLALSATATGGTYDRLKAAYTYLDQKKFAYLFYQWYENKGASIPEDTKKLDHAKQYCKKLITQLPADKRAQVKQSLDKLIVSSQTVPGISELEVYRFAIEILQSPDSANNW